MARKRTGLRNRWRNGRGSYSKRKKGAEADRYGSWTTGKLSGGEVIAGHSINRQLPALENKR